MFICVNPCVYLRILELLPLSNLFFMTGSYLGVKVAVLVRLNRQAIQQHLAVLRYVKVLQQRNTGTFPTA